MDSNKDIIIHAVNGRRLTQKEAEDQYGVVGVYTMQHSLSFSELYSGSRKDPMVWANLDAERFAVDDFGNKLPYDVTISLQALNINKPLELMSAGCRKVIMRTQVLTIHVVVFKSEWHKEMYDMAEACVIKEQ